MSQHGRLILSVLLMCIGYSYSVIPFGAEKGLPGGSPRFTSYNTSGSNGLALGYEFVSGPNKQIISSISPDGNTWGPSLVIVSQPNAISDLANPNLYQLPNGRLVCAFRHHTMQAGQPTIYRIEICYTDDMKGWNFLGTIEAYSTTTKVGIWEPFLYQVRGDPALYCAYAKELSNGQQNIVSRSSMDGGKTWGNERIISHTANSRDGMPSVTALPDGSLLAVFEGFWAGVWNKFTVNSRRSFDGGRTWGDPEVVHVSPGAHNSGAPWAATLSDGRVVVVFMTDEDHNGTLNWPNYASIKLVVGKVQGNTIAWGDLQTIEGESSFWPSTYYWSSHHDLLASYNAAYRQATI